MTEGERPGSTRIKRSGKWTVFSLLIAAVFVGGALLVFPKGYGLWAIGVAAAGILLAVGVFFTSGAAPCPSCGKEITPLAFGVNRYVRCPACGSYAEGESGALWAIEPGRIAERPEFALSLPERPALPDLCCACGAEAVRTERITIRTAMGRGPLALPARLPMRGIDVPHCAFHKGGAALDGEASREFSVDAMRGAVTVLRVRSYRFYRAFRELNGG